MAQELLNKPQDGPVLKRVCENFWRHTILCLIVCDELNVKSNIRCRKGLFNRENRAGPARLSVACLELMSARLIFRLTLQLSSLNSFFFPAVTPLLRHAHTPIRPHTDTCFSFTWLIVSSPLSLRLCVSA
jgi:hypothetical protein